MPGTPVSSASQRRILLPLQVVSVADRFCEDCGAPLTPGIRFCEQCGVPVPAGPALTPVRADPSRPVTAPPPEARSRPAGEQILAVFPFAFRHKGVIGSEDLSLVFTSRRILPVPVSEGTKPIFKAAKKNLDTQIRDLERKKTDRIPFLAPLAFDPRPFFPPWQELFPVLPEGVGIPLADIQYIRCEYPDERHILSEDLVIRTPAGDQLFSSEGGWYEASVSRLMTLVWNAMDGGAREEVVGIIPLCDAGEWGSRSLWYYFTLIVTTRRILFSSLSDPEKDLQDSYLNRQETKAGGDRRTVVERFADHPPADAPWVAYLQKPLSEVFDKNPVSYFIPLEKIRSVVIQESDKDKADCLCFSFFSEGGDSVTTEPGFGRVAYGILSRALGDRVTIEKAPW